MKEAFSPSENNRINQNIILVNEVMLDQCLDESGTAGKQDVLTRLLFQVVGYL